MSATTINLNSSLDGFDKIAVEFYLRNDIHNLLMVETAVSVFRTFISSATQRICLVFRGGVYVIRLAEYISDTKVGISDAKYGGTGSADNVYCIPTNIYGIKE